MKEKYFKDDPQHEEKRKKIHALLSMLTPWPDDEQAGALFKIPVNNPHPTRAEVERAFFEQAIMAAAAYRATPGKTGGGRESWADARAVKFVQALGLADGKPVAFSKQSLFADYLILYDHRGKGRNESISILREVYGIATSDQVRNHLNNYMRKIKAALRAKGITQQQLLVFRGFIPGNPTE